VVAANCQLPTATTHGTVLEGRKEESGKNEAERWERTTEREETRGEERSTRVKEDGGGQQRRRTDGRTTVADFVGWLGFQVC